MAINIIQNYKRGGIRQGNVFLIFKDATTGTLTANGLGRIRNPSITFEPVESESDSQGRTTVIAYNLNATVTMMQHEHEEIEAAGKLAYPDDGSPEEQGYTVLFTDGPMSAADVEGSLNAAEQIIPGIMLERVFPKPSPSIDFGTEDSAIEITINGMLPPNALATFATRPVISFT